MEAAPFFMLPKRALFKGPFRHFVCGYFLRSSIDAPKLIWNAFP
jgi:hypothetical protein